MPLASKSWLSRVERRSSLGRSASLSPAETGIAPVCSLGLPPEIDVIAAPDRGLAFLEPAFEVAAGIGAFALAGVTYGTIGKISGAPRW